MKFSLKDYQREAVREVLDNIEFARDLWHSKSKATSFSLSAVTGAGKTVMAAAIFEALFYGADEYNFDADPGAVVIWFSDDPSLNEQTRFRIMEASDRINHSSLVVVENNFCRPKFEEGKIYFLNTQKLGKNSLLVRGHDQAELEADAGALLPETKPDLRAYTIWETIQNTIEDPALTLYLVLDEAHRGMGDSSVADPDSKSTIVKRLINGAAGIKGVPIVWGISATVDRFNKAMALAVARTKPPDVVVDAAKVQDSGLIKDTILLDFPDETGDFDTVLVRRATDKLKESTKAWADYAKRQGDFNAVVPLMVLQIPNTPDPDVIGRILDTICDRYPELTSDNIAHVLGEHTMQRYGNRDVPYIAPQRVQDANHVRVLIAKDAISTGWDCPRAEVMVSFRSASDETHITQLLGRMVRSPLARRIPGDDRLNSVSCLLPKFNRKTVERVVNALTSGDGGSQATPGRILIKPVEVKPHPDAPQQLWDLFTSLPSQSRPQREAKPIIRLTSLAHELAFDGIFPNAGKSIRKALHKALDDFRAEHEDKVAIKRGTVLTVDGKTIKSDLNEGSRSLNAFNEDADAAVKLDAFRRASRIFSPDVSLAYAEHIASKNADSDQNSESDQSSERHVEALDEARVTIASLGLVFEIQEFFDRQAEDLANALLSTHQAEINALRDSRREAYRQIVEMSPYPQDVALVKPQAKFEPSVALEGGTEIEISKWSRHLLCDDNGSYPAELNSWERRIVETEMGRKGSRFWYRNPQQSGQSSIGIAYLEDDHYKIVRPDFVFFVEIDGRFVAELVDPHGLHLADALPKLKGLAAFAHTHADAFGRIESVAEVDEVLRKLDLKRSEVREEILAAKSAIAVFRSTLANDYK
jgi:hypothetical protein